MDIGDDTGCPGACRDARDPMPPLASQTRCVYDYGDTPGGREQLLPKPWPALWAMMVGFFMIMLDSTVVAIANPTIMAQLRIGYATVVWVTSAYLLAYAVPMLVAGRLGDRFGPKNLYLIGLGYSPLRRWGAVCRAVPAC